MGEHFAAASCLALVLNFLLLWVAAPPGIAAGRTEDGLSLQWEKAPPPMREVELGVVRLKRGAKTKRYGHSSFTVPHTRE